MEWRDIEDEKPADNQLILAHTITDRIISGRYHYTCNFKGRDTIEENRVIFKTSEYTLSLEIDYWMPIEEFENEI